MSAFGERHVWDMRGQERVDCDGMDMWKEGRKETLGEWCLELPSRWGRRTLKIRFMGAIMEDVEVAEAYEEDVWRSRSNQTICVCSGDP